jgi:hypothetical protein
VFVLVLSALSLVVQARNEAFRQSARNRPDTTRRGTNALDMKKREAPVSRATESRDTATGSRQDTRRTSSSTEQEPYECTLNDTVLTCTGHEDSPAELNNRIRVVGGAGIKHSFVDGQGGGYADRCFNCKYKSDTGELICRCAVHERVKDPKGACELRRDRARDLETMKNTADCATVRTKITDIIQKSLAESK